jgi:hypothetical protein
LQSVARVSFEDAAVPPKPGIVKNVDHAVGGHAVFAILHIRDFIDWYDFLRNEKPVWFSYSYTGLANDPTEPERDLQWVTLHTGLLEPPGEGSEEVPSPISPSPRPRP